MSINLLPPDLRREEARFPWPEALLAFVLAWTCAFLLFCGWTQIQRRQARLAEAQTAASDARRQTARLAASERRLAKLESEAARWREQQKRNRVFAELLEGIRWLVPPDLWFTDLELTQAGELHLRGGARTLASLSRFLAELKRFPPLAEVRLQQAKLEGEGKYYFFALTAQVPAEGGKARVQK